MARRRFLLSLRPVVWAIAVGVAVLIDTGVAEADETAPPEDSLFAGVIDSEPDEYGDVRDIVHLIGEYTAPGSSGKPNGPILVDDPAERSAHADPAAGGDGCQPWSPLDPCDLVVLPASESPEPAVTLRDIASFRPAMPADVMEPDGWAVVGLPANFVSGASVRVVGGSLLGRPAEVRFTPVGYAWASSDGGRVASASPGATWAALGVREFSATGTSLVFADRGTYEVQSIVTFRAEYRFNGSVWRPIAGALDLSSPTRSVLVGEFDTVLVSGDCVVRPDGPGC